MASDVPPQHRSWRTWPNALSVFRLLAALPCAWAMVVGWELLAVGLLTGAIASDLLDGSLARRYDQVTPLGGFLDHGSDALFVTTLLGALAWQGLVPAMLPVLVLAAFAQYALDSRVIDGRELRASAIGRANGVLYFVLAGTPIVRDALGGDWPGDLVVYTLGWGLVFSTTLSMADRLRVLLRR